MISDTMLLTKSIVLVVINARFVCTIASMAGLLSNFSLDNAECKKKVNTIDSISIPKKRIKDRIILYL